MVSLQNVLAVLCLFLITFGSVALALTLVAPALLDKPVIQRMLTGNLAPTRLNRALVSIWAILSGSYLLLLFAEQRLICYIVLSAWLPLSIAVIGSSARSCAESHKFVNTKP